MCVILELLCLQILVLVANFHDWNMNTEVEQGSMSTTFGCGLVGLEKIFIKY